MSKNAVKIPKIAITAESDDNGAHKVLHIEETHTDVEELESEKPRTVNRRSRLKIKATCDGYVTDMEDLELSDAEEEYKVPFSLLPDGIFELDGGVIEEVHQTDATSGNTVSQENIRSYGLKIDDFDSGKTDVEDYCTENEFEEKEIAAASLESYGFLEQVSEKTVVNISDTELKKSKSKRRRKRSKQILTSPSDIDDDVSDVSGSKTLTLPSVNSDILTDVEDIDVTERKSSSLSPVVLKGDLKEQEITDIESLESDIDLREKVQIDDKAIDDIMYHEKFFCVIRRTNKFEGEVLNWNEVVKIGETENYEFLEANNLLTDEEVLSNFDSCEQRHRAPSPNIQLSEEAVVCYKERSKEGSYLQNAGYVSDSEAVVAGAENTAFLKPAVQDGYYTKVEDFNVEGEPYNIPLKQRRKLSTTDIKNLELSDDEYETSRIDQQAASFRKRKLIRQNFQNNATDVEDLEISGEETVTFSRAETATPVNVHHELDSMCSSKVHSVHIKKINLNTPEEQLYVKGGGVEEVYTDFEDLSVSEADNKICRKRLSVDLAEDKITVTVKQMAGDVSLNWNNYTVKFGISSGEGKK